MKRAVSILVLSCLPWLAIAAAKADACVECHATRAEDRLRAPVSAQHDGHGRGGLGCAACHGGDPMEPTAMAHDLGRGFVGRPAPLALIRMCGACHDGTTDAPSVMEDYRAGAHASAVFSGRPAADCASCHRPHDVERLEPTTAQARCVACHADDRRMRSSDIPTDQLGQWSASVHGAAAPGSGAPGCVGCHGPHQNRAGLAAAESCGRCHADIRAAFEAGPHADAFSRLGFLDCVECHGSHEIAPPGGRMMRGLSAVCARCHGPGQPAFERVRALGSFAEGIDRARVTDPADARRAAVAHAVHSLDPDALREAVDSLDVPAPEQAASAPGLASGARWTGGAVVLGLLFLGILGVWGWVRWRRR